MRSDQGKGKRRWTLPLVLLAVIFLAMAVWVGLVLLDIGQGFRHLASSKSLQAAVAAGDVNEAKRLLDEGADANFMDMWTPLSGAVQRANVPMTRLLLERGADVNARDFGGQTPLMSIVRREETDEQVEIVRLLLRNRADVTLKDNYGNTAWDVARETVQASGKDRGSSRVVRLLKDAAASR